MPLHLDTIIQRLQSHADYVDAIDPAIDMFQQLNGERARAIQELSRLRDLLAERDELIAAQVSEIERLKKLVSDKHALPTSIQEALNSGDGTYRP